GVDDLRKGHVVLCKFGGIEEKLKLSSLSSEVRDVRHSECLFEPRNHYPLLQFPKLTLIPEVRLERVAIDFANRRGQRIKPRSRARREIHPRNAFLNSLAGPIVIHSVLKDESDKREAKSTAGAHHLQARNSVQLALQ